MRPRRLSLTPGHPWDRTVGAGGDTAPDRRAERFRPGPSQRASYEPHPWRECLKPSVDDLQDTLEDFEGEPTPEDHRR